jgi:hypothetical protein
MAKDKDTMQLKTAVILFLLIIVISTLVEAAFLIYSYLNADEIKCNWIWCEFTTKRSQSIIEQECYINGQRVNCTEIRDREHFCVNGRCEMDGVMSIDEFENCTKTAGCMEKYFGK